MTDIHPTAVITARHESIHPPANYPQWTPAPGLVEDIQYEERPLPVEQSSFWPIGRSWDHAAPHSRLQMQMAIPEWLSVIGWPFLPGMRAGPGSTLIYQHVGAQNPIGERVSIHQPAQSKLSDLTEVQTAPSVPLSGAYLKLL